MSHGTRVLVVDDSAFARKVVRQTLEKDPRLEVVGIAADGLEALEKIAALAPDVVTLDLVMPHLDGLGVLRELASGKLKPRVVVVSISDEASELVVQALQLGAVDFVKKPTALATDRLYELGAELVDKVLAAATAKSPLPAVSQTAAAAVPATTHLELLVIGTSTGGPPALTRLLRNLPEDFPLPIAIALHIPAEYTKALAERLHGACALDVVEASDDLILRPGLVALAKGGIHLRVRREGQVLRAGTPTQPRTGPYFPSVDLLFESAAAACGAATLGVVLTGMGDDGLIGSRAIVAAGGKVLTEAEGSCVVYGMPRSVREAGLSAGEARIEEMADAIVRRL